MGKIIWVSHHTLIRINFHDGHRFWSRVKRKYSKTKRNFSFMQQDKQVPRMNSFVYFTSQIHRTLIKMLHESAPPLPPHCSSSPFFHIKIYDHCSNHLLFSLIQKKVAIKEAAYYVISVLRFLSDQKQPKIIYVDFSAPLLFMQN